MTAPRPVTWPKEAPYKGLSFYTPQDVALFAGRQADVRQCARLLADEETNVLLLQGRSGCGKSSFLRAGLIPYLESRVPVFKFLSNFDITKTQALFVRCTDAPLTRLAETLYDWGGQPFVIQEGESEPLRIDTASIRGDAKDRTAFVDRVGSSVEELMAVLRKVHEIMPKRLIIVIDQGEEILTLTRDEEGQRLRDLFFNFLAQFKNSSLSLKLVVALRSEFFGDFLAEMRSRNYEPSQLQWFLLKELSEAGLVEAISVPTSRSIPDVYLQGRKQPADEYHFRFEDDLPKNIVRDLMEMKNKQGGVLPILQVACGRLYSRTKHRYAGDGRPWKITAQDYKDLGDLGSQVGLYLDETIAAKITKELPGLDEAGQDEELALWKDLLSRLVVVEEDGRSLTDISSEEDLRQATHDLECKIDFDVMVGYLADDDQRVLRRDPRSAPDGADQAMQYYSLGHDAIAVALTRWRPTRDLILDRRGFMRRTFLKAIRITAQVLIPVSAGLFAASFFGPTWTWRRAAVAAGLLVIAMLLWVARVRMSEWPSRVLVNAKTVSESLAHDRQTRVVIRRMQASFNDGQPTQASHDERQVLQGAEDALRAKPEKDYTDKDWAERAFASYAQHRLDLAAEYFARAAQATSEAGLRAQCLYNRGVVLNELNRHSEALAAYTEVAAQFASASEAATREVVAASLLNKGISLSQLGRTEEELAAYADLTTRFAEASEPEVRVHVAKGLFNKGYRLGQLERVKEELAAYADVVSRFGEAREPALQEQVAKALSNTGVRLGDLGRGEEAVAAYSDVVTRFSKSAGPALERQLALALFNKGVTLGQLGRREEELAVYADMASRFAGSTEPAVQVHVAKALFNTGIRLGERGRAEEAATTYAEIGARFSKSAAPAVREQVAMALINQAVTLGQLGRVEEELAVYADVASRFGEATEPALQVQVAKALYNTGVRLGERGRADEAMAAYSSVVTRFHKAADPAVQEQVAMALFNKALALGNLGRGEEEMAVYADLVSRYGATTDPALQEQVAMALVNTGFRLGYLGRVEKELAVYADVVSRFGEKTEPALQVQVAKALYNTGVRLSERGKGEDAVAAYADVVTRFSKSAVPAVQEQVAMALFNKAVALGHLGREEEEMAVYADLVSRFGEATAPALQEHVAKALFNTGIELGERGRGEEAVAAYAEVVTRFSHSAAPALQEQVAMALVNQGFGLCELGRREEGLSVYADVVSRFGNATEPALQVQVAKALYNTGNTLVERGRREDAVASYTEIVTRFANTTAPALQEQVATALIKKGVLAGESGRSEEELAAYDDVVTRFGKEPVLAEHVATALLKKGISLRKLGREEAGRGALEEVIRRFGSLDDESIADAVKEASELLKTAPA